MAGNKKIVGLILTLMATLIVTGCSDDAVTVAPPSVDTAPPAAAANLTGRYSPSFDVVVLNWAENTVDSDLAGYLVTREHDGQSVDLVSSPLLAQYYQDPSAQNGENIYYVSAIDESGNESAVATISVMKGQSSSLDLRDAFE